MNHLNRLEGIEMFCQPFQKLTLADNSVNLIVADPMWGDLGQFRDLAVFAKRVLAPSGKLLLFSGSLDLPEKLDVMKEHLNFVLPLGIVYTWPRAKLARRLAPGLPVHQSLASSVKGYVGKFHYYRAFSLLTLWAKGSWKTISPKPFCNVHFTEKYKKEFHDCQQSLAAIQYFLVHLTEPGQLVVEPFGGGFTVAQACRLTGRRCIACDIKPGCVAVGRQRLLETDR